MSEVHFFQAARDGARQAARQVIEKSLEREENVVVRVPDEAEVQRLDDWLWKCADDSFIPHGVSGDDDADQEPVYITAGTDVPNEATVLLLLGGAEATIEEMEQFDRVAVAFDDETRDEARQMWQLVQDSELQPQLVKQDARGRWVPQKVPARTKSSPATAPKATAAAADATSPPKVAPAKADESPAAPVAKEGDEEQDSDSDESDDKDNSEAKSAAKADTKPTTKTVAKSAAKAEGKPPAKSTAKSAAAAKESKMSDERTLSIIKPDATARNLTGKINAMLEEAGLRIVAQRRLRLSREGAEAFYAVHKGKPFFDELCEFMSSGPIVAQVLQGKDAVQKNREVMGATNPEEADKGTIRKEFANSIGENSVHGSDSPENAAIEIAFFFSSLDIVD